MEDKRLKIKFEDVNLHFLVGFDWVCIQYKCEVDVVRCDMIYFLSVFSTCSIFLGLGIPT